MNEDFWVFAYGSLIWKPGFAFNEAQPAKLYGWHRSMCVLSTHYRGHPTKPGLVLGLDRGGSCLGLAYAIAADQAEEVRRYLHEREMITAVYQPCTVPLRLLDGRRVQAYTFTAKTDHPQYAGRLARTEACRLVCQGVGKAGTSRYYLAATVAHLDALGLADHHLHHLLRMVDAVPQPNATSACPA